MDFLNQWFHNLDPVVTFFRALQGVIAAGVLWALKLLFNIGKNIAKSGDREKALETKLKKANDEILELYDHKDEDRQKINQQHQNLLSLARRIDALEERAETAEARVKKLENILSQHNIKEDVSYG